MWEIYEHRKVSKQLSALPIEILKRYEKWKDIVRISGPSGLKFIKGFHDEALRGEDNLEKKFTDILAKERSNFLTTFIEKIASNSLLSELAFVSNDRYISVIPYHSHSLHNVLYQKPRTLDRVS